MKMQSGFTLLELMITVSVAAILLAVGVPGFQEFVRNNRQAAEVNKLVATLQLARSEAIARNKLVGVCPTTAADNDSCSGSTNWATGWIVFVDESSNGVREDAEEVLRMDSGPEQMSVQAEVTSLTYRPNGRIYTYPTPANGTPANFVFCDSRGADHARVVQLEIAGRPNAADTKIGGTDPTCPSS